MGFWSRGSSYVSVVYGTYQLPGLAALPAENYVLRLRPGPVPSPSEYRYTIKKNDIQHKSIM